MAIKSLSIRIEEEMLDKLHVVADYEGRSANSQILVLIRDLVEAYEQKHGEIKTGKRQLKSYYPYTKRLPLCEIRILDRLFFICAIDCAYCTKL